MKFVHPMEYTGSYSGWWAGYKYKDVLGYDPSGKHTGVDYNWGSGHADANKPCRAIYNGVVVYAKSTGGGFGNTIIIRHTLPEAWRKESGAKKYMYSRYLHLNKISVKVGTAVVSNQLIGLVGNTGTTWSHLHLDIWTDKNGLGAHTAYHSRTQLDSYLDPFKWIEAHDKAPVAPKVKTYTEKQYKALQTKYNNIKKENDSWKKLIQTTSSQTSKLSQALAKALK